MFTPIIFLDPGDELKSLQALAVEQFADFYEFQKAVGAGAPTVEQVYPRLVALARHFGYTAACPIEFMDYTDGDLAEKATEVRELVAVVFAKAPSAVRDLLSIQQPMQLPPAQEQKSLLPDLPQAQKEPAALPPAVQPSGFVPANLPPVSLSTSATPVPNEEGTRGKAKDVAYEVAQALLSKVRIKILGEAIYSYTGRFYQHITGENLRRLIMLVCRKEVENEGNSRLVGEVYRLLMVEPAICEKPEQISSDLVSFENGVLDLKAGQLHPHDPRFNTYYEIKAKYASAGQPHPVFDQFLASITGGDMAMAQRVLEIIGYCLVPDTKGKVFFVFQGVPDSGKSVLAAFIRGCFNDDATVAMDILSLGERFAVSSLIGRQICTSMDMPAAPLNAKSVSTFKQLTGGDPITTDVKYAAHITFYNQAKFIFGTNHLLLTQNSDPAFYRRAIVVPFLNTIPKEHQDFNLLEKLNNERDAIVYDAIQAYLMLRARHYVFAGDYTLNAIFGNLLPTASPSVETMLCQFVRESCVIGDEYDAFVDDLYSAFTSSFGSGTISYERFSAALLDACATMGLNYVRKTQKKRGPGDKNPRAHLAGIALLRDVADEAAGQVEQSA